MAKEADDYPCIVTADELGFMISFEIGQVPRSVLHDLLSRDSFKRERARGRITGVLVGRLDRFHIRKGPPLPAHDGSATRARRGEDPKSG